MRSYPALRVHHRACADSPERERPREGPFWHYPQRVPIKGTRWQSALILHSATSSGYRSNVLTENNGGNANPQVSGGTNLGHNLCGFALCP